MPVNDNLIYQTRRAWCEFHDVGKAQYERAVVDRQIVQRRILQVKFTETLLRNKEQDNASTSNS
jgi:hypothetical protein